MVPLALSRARARKSACGQNGILLLTVLVSCLAPGLPLAQGREPTSAPVATSQPAVTTETQRLVDRPDERVSILANGMTVILKAHRTAPVVSVRMYCETGSIYEQEYLGSGMSHLFEHLLHSGATSTRSEKEAARILDDIGGNTNAFTSYDMTCYFINTATQHLAMAVELLGDWITRPTFPQEAFEREWGVVQRELERDIDDPDTQLYETAVQTLYREHPVRFPVIGFQPVVQKLKKEDIVGYYHRMYIPDKIVVSIAGDLDIDAALATVQKQFASFTRCKVPTIVLPEEPDMTSPRFATRRMKVEASMLELAWPSVPLIHPDLYALDVLSYVLTQGESSRLVREVRDKGLAFDVSTSSWTPAWAKGMFAVVARTAPDKLDAARTAILEQIVHVQEDLVSEEELAQAKRQKATEHTFAMQKAENIAEMMASDFMSTGDVHFSQSYVDKIQRVTPQQVRDVARRYLSPNRLATISVVPEDYRATADQSPTKNAPEPVRLIKLDNGLRCLIRRDPTTPLVAIQSYSLGGVVLEDSATSGLSRLAANLAARGTTKRGADEISRFFDAHGIEFDNSSSANSIFFKAQVLKNDFESALDIFADVVCNPTFPQDQLDALRPRQLDDIAKLDENWRSETIAFFQSRFFRNSPYRFPQVGTRSVVEKATREQVANFYHHCVTGPDTVIAVFGDIDPGQVENLLRKYFASLPSKRAALPDISDPKPEQPVLYIKPKPPTRSVTGLAVGFPGMKITDMEDVAKMAVLDTIISGYRYPTGWLFNSLRGGDKSLVYEVHAQNVPGLIPGYFGIYANCQPDQVKTVYDIIAAQLDKARRGEFTDHELSQARSIINTTEIMESQTNSERASQACSDELYGLGYDYRDRFRQRVEKVTLEEVIETAIKYFTIPTVAVVTPAPDQVKLGIKDVQIEKSNSNEKSTSKEQ